MGKLIKDFTNFRFKVCSCKYGDFNGRILKLTFLFVADWAHIHIQFNCRHRSTDAASSVCKRRMGCQSMHYFATGIYEVSAIKSDDLQMFIMQKIINVCKFFLCLCSFVTVTFVIESMSVANAILWRRKIDRGRSYDFDSGDSAILISASAPGRRPQREERDPLIPPELTYHHPSESFSTMSDFEIKERTEMVRKLQTFIQENVFRDGHSIMKVAYHMIYGTLSSLVGSHGGNVFWEDWRIRVLRMPCHLSLRRFSYLYCSRIKIIA